MIKLLLTAFVSLAICIGQLSAKDLNQMKSANKGSLKILGADIAGVFRKNDSKNSLLKNILGREERIISSLADCMGYKIEVTLAPYGRHVIWFNESDKFDAVATVAPNSAFKGHSSNSHISYNNGVSFLQGKAKFERLQDLKGKRVISFVGARDMYPDLKKIIPQLASYTEKSDQRLHTKMLFTGRKDAVISDGVIFATHTSELRRKKPDSYKDRVSFKQLFKPTDFFVVFKKEKLRDSFNSCLKTFKKHRKSEIINNEFYYELIINN